MVFYIETENVSMTNLFCGNYLSRLCQKMEQNYICTQCRNVEGGYIYFYNKTEPDFILLLGKYFIQ